MSLVQAFIYKDFIIVGGEQRAIFNTHISENYVKVFKLNSTTIVGFTGSISGNALLFGDYINEDFSLSELCNSSYNEIENHLSEKFHQNISFLEEVGIHSIVCGWDGIKMTGKAFFTNDPITNGIFDITPESLDQLRIVNCGEPQHYNNVISLGQKLNNINILQLKNLFKDVISIGVNFDSTINDNVTFEQIRKVDVI